MISAGHHDSLDDPPQIPAITGITPKRKKQESLAEALAGVAAAFAGRMCTPQITQANSNVVIATPESPTKDKSSSSQVGLSPGRISELRMKNLKLQQLLEQNILTSEEFAEQKTIVLNSMRKLTS